MVKRSIVFEELTTLQYDIGFRTNIKVDSLTKFIAGFLWQAQTGDIIDLSITINFFSVVIDLEVVTQLCVQPDGMLR